MAFEMASPTIPSEYVFTSPAAAHNHSVEDAISPSQPLPAEHPSHSRGNSKEEFSPRTNNSDSNTTPKPKSTALRGKSNSLSFPVLVNTAINNPPPTQTATNKRSTNALRITVPSSNNDSNFLTTLAAQERHVLELKEELAKAEASLVNLKKQWASHEARRRESESRRLHKLKPISSDVPPTPRFPSFAGGMTTPKAMFEEMQRRKASMDQRRSPRQRRFSGSREMRALSLVSPDALRKMAEQAEQIRNASKQDQLTSPTIVESPSGMPPTPDLVHEEDEEEDHDTATATDSQRSSQSPRQRRHMVRSSMQMAVDFREGLWTFFEDLKQATYGEEARIPDGRPRAASRPDLLRKEVSTQHQRDNSASGRPKRTVRRQTWQIRPKESTESMIDMEGQHYKLSDHKGPTKRMEQRREEPSQKPNGKEYRPPFPPKSPSHTPAKLTTPRHHLYEKEIDGEVWQTWDTPRNGSLASTPVLSRSRNSSIDTQARTSSKEEGKRNSLQWPALKKLRPGQLTRTASQLMEEWERSFTPPPTYQQVQQLQHEDGRVSPRPASPRPISRKSNSRLDLSYA